MNPQEIIKLFKENELWVEECPLVPQTFTSLYYAFMRQNKHLGKVCHKYIFEIGILNYGYEVSLVKEKDAVFEQLKYNLIKDKNFLNKKIDEWKLVTKKLKELINKSQNLLEYINTNTTNNKEDDDKEVDNNVNDKEVDDNVNDKEVDEDDKEVDDNKDELAKLYEGIIFTLADSWSYPIMGEGCDPFSTHRLIPQIKRELKIDDNEGRDIAIILSKAKVKSFLDDEKLGLLKLALLKKQGVKSSAKFKVELKKHTANYYWIKNNYLDTFVLDDSYFLKEIEHLSELSLEEIKHKIKELENYENTAKKEKNIIYNKYANGKYILSEDLKLSISILETMSWWIDQRKIVMLQGFHAIFRILGYISKTYNDYTIHDLKYATHAEIIWLLSNIKPINKPIDKQQLLLRKQCNIQVLDSDENWTIIVGKKAEEIRKVFMQKFAVKEIRGLTASVGKENVNIQGEVSVVSNVNKDYFKPGSILVTSMTRPEFVPLMRKAIAIVTDEGGITCHAAIVSRELGIPCIIGTRVATKILKTGDKIEVDIKKGVVKKI